MAEDNNRAIGFVAFTENLNKLYKSAIKSKGIKFVFSIGFKLFKPSVCKRIFQNIFYPAKTEKLNLPQAELLSIVIDPESQGRGIARQLSPVPAPACASTRETRGNGGGPSRPRCVR